MALYVKLSAPILLIALACASSCTGVRVVAQVGRYAITDKDVKYRDTIIKLYYPEEKRSMGLAQLIQAYTDAQILINNGHTINDQVILNEEKRIDKSTRMPELLNKIKAVFGADLEAYRRVYVLPVYAQRVIYYTFFLHDSNVQRDSLAVAQKFVDQAIAPTAGFFKIANKSGLKVEGFEISPHEGFTWDFSEKLKQKRQAAPAAVTSGEMAKIEQMQNKQTMSEAKRWLDEVAGSLKPGQVFPKVIDGNETWQVVKYIGPSSKTGRHRFESVFFPKADYAKWLEAEKAKVKVIRH